MSAPRDIFGVGIRSVGHWEQTRRYSNGGTKETVRKRRVDSEGKFGTDSADSGSDIKNYENNVKPDYF